MLEDDLTPLFTAAPAGAATPMLYRQGVIRSWNPITLENTVKVGRTVLSNLPVLGVAEAASLAEGATVGIMSVGSTWAIIGRFVIPGTADATDAITQLGSRTRTARIDTNETLTTAAWSDLATVGPLVSGVLVPASGIALVTVTATIGPNPTVAPEWGAVGFDIAGPSNVAPNLNEALLIWGARFMGASRTCVVTGLTPGGPYTFTMKYHGNGTFLTNFSNRVISVVGI